VRGSTLHHGKRVEPGWVPYIAELQTAVTTSDGRRGLDRARLHHAARLLELRRHDLPRAPSTGFVVTDKMGAIRPSVRGVSSHRLNEGDLLGADLIGPRLAL